MNKSVLLLPFFMLACSLVVGQTGSIDRKFSKAEELRKSYRFKEAAGIYKEIISESSDTNYHREILSLIAKCENGTNMLSFASTPKVLGSAEVPYVDFFLNYNFENGRKWIKLPDKIGGLKTTGTFQGYAVYNDKDKRIYFSAVDNTNRSDIYFITKLDDGRWSSPENLELVNSPADEILPVLSSNGKELFFSSNGLFGVGGFDVYVSKWDDNTSSWSFPQNLGFPYSTPFDDLLYLNSDDGKYTFLSSNRKSKGTDKLTIYKLEFDNIPLRRSISNLEEIAQIASMETVAQQIANGTNVSKKRPVVEGSEEYSMLVNQVRRIQTDIEKIEKELNESRQLLQTLSSEADKQLIIRTISERERDIFEKQQELRATNQKVQKSEMDFFSKGVLIPRTETKPSTNNDTTNTAQEFIPKKAQAIVLNNLIIKEPEVVFDYQLKKGDKAIFAPDQTIPDGLVYRIQLFLISKKAESKQLKGLSPIFETRTKTGKFLYTAGQFYTMAEAKEGLAFAKRSGFPSALIVAYSNRETVSLREASSLEEKQKKEIRYQIKISGFPDGITNVAMEAIKNSTDKDIAKRVINNKTIYFIGPFTSRSEAEKLETILKDSGVKDTTLEEIKSE